MTNHYSGPLAVQFTVTSSKSSFVGEGLKMSVIRILEKERYKVVAMAYDPAKQCEKIMMYRED